MGIMIKTTVGTASAMQYQKDYGHKTNNTVHAVMKEDTSPFIERLHKLQPEQKEMDTYTTHVCLHNLNDQ